ncbi:MAG: acetate--CoA ligase family protein [Candidatus Krumholzibacteria bacterium]|nr:acetate--CoA ligase family protein [Candidatus Krumholzibacteria bacterium]
MDNMIEPRVLSAVEKILLGILDEGREIPREDEVYSVLNLLGFETPETIFVTSAEEIDDEALASLPGDRVVCKFVSPQVVHRTEHGGIVFTDKDAVKLREVFAGFKSIASRLGVELSGMLVARMLDIDDSVPRQLILSLRQDRAFGPVVAAGLGGTGTEVWNDGLKKDRGLRVMAASMCAEKEFVEQALTGTTFFPMISGHTRVSSQPMLEPGTFVEAVRRFASLAASFSPLSDGTPVTIEELEVNPLQITGDGGLVPLDAMMKLSRIKGSREAAPQNKIDRLLRPESMLVIGASAGKINMGRVILKNLAASETIPLEKIYLIHPEADEIEGCAAFKSPADLPEKVDATVFTIPASEKSEALLEDLIFSEKTESIILISGGFGETEGGRELSVKLKRAITCGRGLPGGGTIVNGPNCMGIISGPGGYNTFFLPEYKFPLEGEFGSRGAVISQSGAWLVTLLNTQAVFLQPRYMITVGNQIDLTITDHLENVSGDPDIEVFCIYIEGFRAWEGERFLELARRITSSGRSIILYKAGRTAEGAAAVASHTAAMAGDYDVLERLIRDTGVHVADSLEEMEDAMKVLTLLDGRRAAGRRVAISSDAGYECSVAADRLGSMELAQFSEKTVERLGELLPTGFIDIHNPIDATPAITTGKYGQCIEAVLADENVDCAIISNVASTPFQENLPPGPGHREDIGRESSHPNTMIRLFHSTEKPIVLCLNEGVIYDPAVEMMERAGVPVFRKIDRATRAMDIFLRITRPKGS